MLNKVACLNSQWMLVRALGLLVFISSRDGDNWAGYDVVTLINPF